MSERVTAYSLNVRPTVFVNIDRTRLFAGGAETKYLFSARDVINSRDTSFVHRVYDRDIIEKWKRMKAVGLPVAPDILLNPMRNFMLVTDVKADGSEVYGEGLQFVLRNMDHSKRERPRPEIDKIFLELTAPHNMPMIEEAAQGIVKIADSNSIELPADDPMEFIIHPDGSWGFVILDLARAKVDRPKDAFAKRMREGNNQLYLQGFIGGFERIRDRLITGRPEF